MAADCVADFGHELDLLIQGLGASAPNDSAGQTESLPVPHNPQPIAKLISYFDYYLERSNVRGGWQSGHYEQKGAA